MSTFNSIVVFSLLLAWSPLNIASTTESPPATPPWATPGPTPASKINKVKASHPAGIPQDCYELLQNGETCSGLYTIQPSGSDPFTVYCDQKTSGGGWTIFQRRQDGSEDFYRDWDDYEEGFGDPKGEFWLGNDKLFHLTNQQNYHLRVDLEDFEGDKRFAEYSTFKVANEKNKYKLEIEGYSGDAGDAMSKSNGNKFSTKDQDNDVWYKSCAKTYKGAWWYQGCHFANLNGLYLEGEHKSYADGVDWKQWHGYYYSLKFTEMKIRPENFAPLSPARDCYELLKERCMKTSGVYNIQPEDSEPFDVYCDMETGGGGWTVFQRRQDGSEDFYRDWADYKEGFGDLEGEYWLGNDKLFHLTQQQTYRLRVDMTDTRNKTSYAEYSKFVVADESKNYKLQIENYSGDAGDGMYGSNNMGFSTKDRDNDLLHQSCSIFYGGGWWYKACIEANLNGHYYKGPNAMSSIGITWRFYEGNLYDLAFSEMKLRPATEDS